MKLLIDQDVYYCTVRFLKSNGHDVLLARDLGMSRSRDIELLEKAKQLSRILVTRDKDFGTLIFFIKAISTGVIFLRMMPLETEFVHSVMKKLFNEKSESVLLKSFCTITSKGYRIRKL